MSRKKPLRKWVNRIDSYSATLTATMKSAVRDAVSVGLEVGQKRIDDYATEPPPQPWGSTEEFDGNPVQIIAEDIESTGKCSYHTRIKLIGKRPDLMEFGYGYYGKISEQHPKGAPYSMDTGGENGEGHGPEGWWYRHGLHSIGMPASAAEYYAVQAAEEAMISKLEEIRWSRD